MRRLHHTILMLLVALAAIAQERAALAQQPEPGAPASRQLIVGIPVSRPDSSGRLVVEPNVYFAPERESPSTEAPAVSAPVTAPPPRGVASRQRELRRPTSSPVPAAATTLPAEEPLDDWQPQGPNLGLMARLEVEPSSQDEERDASGRIESFENDPVDIGPASAHRAAPALLATAQPVDEIAPLPAPSVYEQFPAGEPFQPVAEPLFAQVVDATLHGECADCGSHAGCGGCDRTDCCECHPCWGAFHRLFDFGVHEPTYDIGIGHERVIYAPFVIDSTQPLNNWRLRFDSVYGVNTPDRAEFLWGRPGIGPELPERSLDYQDGSLLIELGGGRASVLTEVSLRMLDPVDNGNTTGFGDMSVGNKLVIVDGDYWQISQVFRTYLNTGSALKGLGTGHVSMEPGVLARYQWNDHTYLHGELKYWFPVGADRNFSGQVLRWGVGVSHVLYETDTFAMLPTLEFVGWSVFDGQKSLPDGTIIGVDGEEFASVHSGMRFVLGPAGDLGLFELGTSGGFMMANNGFFESLFRIDLRWSF